MDRRSLLLLSVACLVMVFWYPLMERIYPPKPLPHGVTNGLVRASAGTNAANDPVGAPAGIATATAPAAAGVAGIAIRPGITDTGFTPSTGKAEELVLEGEDGRYVFTSAGGGIRQVELKGHNDAMTWSERKAAKPVRPAIVNLSLIHI